MKRNLTLLIDIEKGDHFRRMHKSVWAMLRYYRENRMGLGYILIPHYRRLIYSGILVSLHDWLSIQLILIIFISELMIITVLNSKPFQS